MLQKATRVLILHLEILFHAAGGDLLDTRIAFSSGKGRTGRIFGHERSEWFFNNSKSVTSARRAVTRRQGQKIQRQTTWVQPEAVQEESAHYTLIFLAFSKLRLWERRPLGPKLQV